jgi:ComF family protein
MGVERSLSLALRAAPSFATDLLAALLSPARCAACDEPVARPASFCPPCARSALRPAPGPTREIAAFVYGGPVARAIARLKYERRPDLGLPLGDLLFRAIERRRSDVEGRDRCAIRGEGRIVIPVPLHPSRLAERGYNQSMLLGHRVARQLGAPFWPLALRRTRATEAQATLDRPRRIANVLRAFEVRRPERLCGRSILLVDDVRTTGATLDACRSALHEAGATDVVWAVVAQSGGPVGL